MRKLSKILLSTLLMLVLVMTFVAVEAKAKFPDLSPMHWCYEKIMDFYERGYVDGDDTGTFRPDDTITRAEYVKIVNNFFGYSKSNKASGLSDVDNDEWFAPYVNEAVSRGYITGYEDGTFRPYEPIRRQEATVILSRILKIDNETYPKNHKDGMEQYLDGDDIEEWAYKAIHSYSVHNFINGYPDKTIRLMQNVTRAETVELLHKLEQKVEIDRPGGGDSSTVRQPKITVVEANDSVEWYNLEEANSHKNDEKITVQVHTATEKATIEVKVNGELQTTREVVVKKGTTVEFELPDGEYTITAKATKKGYKNSKEAVQKHVRVDTVAPIAEGIEKEDGVEVDVFDSTRKSFEISGVNEETVKYAWLEKVGSNSYKRVSDTWEELPEGLIKLPEGLNPGKYYLGITAYDNAGNVTTGYKDRIVVANDDGTEEVIEIDYTIVTEKDVPEEKVEEPEEPGDPGEDQGIVTFYANNGTGKTTSQLFDINVPANLNPNTFTRKGYKFVGWSTTSDGKVEYKDKATYTLKSTEGANLYAVWEEIKDPIVVATKHTIRFVAGENGELEGKTEFVNVPYGSDFEDVIDVPTPKADIGYSFDKWNVRDFPSKILGDAEYTASFKINQYTATFILNNGKSDVVITKDYKSALEAPTNLKKTGYTFVGWDKEVPTTMPAEDTTYEAIWKINEYTLTIKYVYEDGEKAKETYTEKYEFEEEYDVAIEVITGYVAKVNNKIETSVTGTMGASDREVTVVYCWNPNVILELDGDKENAETGDSIEYTLVIENKESIETDVEIKLPSDATITEGTLPSKLGPNEKVTIKFKRTIPEEHDISKNYETTVTADVKKGDEVKVIEDTACNGVEKTVVTYTGKTQNKNITLILDMSGSMQYASCSHNIIGGSSDWIPVLGTVNKNQSPKTLYRYNNKTKDNVPTTYQLTLDMFNNKGGESDGYVYCSRPYMGHEVYENGKWVECKEAKNTRIEILKVAVKDFINSMYDAAKQNKETVNISIITFRADVTVNIKGQDLLKNKNSIISIVDEMLPANTTNIKGALEKATEIINETKKEDMINYAIFFGDGEPTTDKPEHKPTNDNYNRFKTEVGSDGFAYAIGFGPDFKNDNSEAAKILNSIVTGEGTEVRKTSTADEIKQVFKNLAKDIADTAKTKSGELEIDVSKFDGNYYPITIMSGDKEIATIEYAKQLKENGLTAENGKLLWDIAHSRYSTTKELKIKLTTVNGKDGIDPNDVISLKLPKFPEEPIKRETPVEEPIKEEVPAEEPVKDETPVEEPIKEEVPAEEPVKDETPVEEPIKEETPAEEPVKDETPVEEPIKEETPVEKPVKDETTVEAEKTVEEVQE